MTPSKISDDSIMKVSKNYRLSRFPVAVWKHKRTKGTLLRYAETRFVDLFIYLRNTISYIRCLTSNLIPWQTHLRCLKQCFIIFYFGRIRSMTWAVMFEKLFSGLGASTGQYYQLLSKQNQGWRSVRWMLQKMHSSSLKSVCYVITTQVKHPVLLVFSAGKR